MRTDIELLRIVSAFGIVWFHSGAPGQDIAYAGIVFFAAVSGYFAVLSRRSHPISARARRLLYPYAAWWIVYALLDMRHGVVPGWQTILVGSAIHLWYLPFIFFCLVTVDRIKPVLRTAALPAAFVLIGTAPYWRQFSPPDPFAQYLHALPAVLMGIAFALRPVASLSLGLPVFVAAMLGLPGFGSTYAVGFVLCLVLIAKSSILPRSEWVLQVGQCTLGVYLAHAAFLLALSHIGVRGAIRPTAAFVLSLLAVLAARKMLPPALTKYFL